MPSASIRDGQIVRRDAVRRDAVRRYAIALAVSLVAAVAEGPAGPHLGEMTPLLALPAVAVAAWSGGCGPGILAALVPIAAVRWLHPARPAMAALQPHEVTGLWLVALTALLICLTMRQLRGHARDERRRRTDVERRLRWTSASETLAAALSGARTSTDVTSACVSTVMAATEAAAGAAILTTSAETEADHGPIAAALRHGELVIARRDDAARDMSGDMSWETNPLLNGHEGAVIVPLVSAARALGAVVLGFDRWRPFEHDEREYLVEAGRLAARALERARLYESAERARADGEAFRIRADAELQERRRAEEAYRESEARYRALAARTHRLYSLSAALSESVTLEAVARAVVQQGRSVVGAAAGSVALCADKDAFETLYAEGYPSSVVEAWRRFPAESGLGTTAAVTTRSAVLVGSFAEWQQRYPRSAATAADGGFTSVASLPLLVDNAPIGVLSFHFTVPINFDDDYRALLTSVAHHAAQAVDRARLYESTQRARVDAEAANQAKDDFLSIVSHELRTPLNAILGWGAMLRDGSLDGAHVERATAAIVSNAARQARLIDDLLDVSRIVAGRVSLDLRDLELADVVRGAVEAALPVAAQQGLELHIDQLPRARVVADPYRLEQVFGNLLANAVKFTPAGGRVTVGGAVDEGTVRVRVSDTGCGIESDVLPQIFERFRQGNSTTARSVGGLGLGLFIVRRLVEAQRGQVVAESAGTNAGATFTVALPVTSASRAEGSRLLRARETDVAAGAARPERPDLSAVHVLVVDDEADACEMMSSALELCGATVTTARSVREALGRLTSGTSTIQVMLADLAMPEEDGYALIHSVRRHPNAAIAQLPAAAVTACAREDERQRALGAGFHAHLAKPITPAQVADTVARLAGLIAASA